MKKSSMPLLYITTNQGQTMSNEFEEIFKSEATCSECGQELEKGMKHKKKGAKGSMKVKGGKELGNEMDPHHGKKPGSFVEHPRAGSLGGPVDRASSTHGGKPPVVHAEKSLEAPFPMAKSVRLATYEGMEDSVLSKSIEHSLTPGALSNLHVPSQRNLAMEQESAQNE